MNEIIPFTKELCFAQIHHDCRDLSDRVLELRLRGCGFVMVVFRDHTDYF